MAVRRCHCYVCMDMSGSRKSPAEVVAAVEAEARIVETPMGRGRMVWRLWGAGPALVLLHGAFGSWNHWLRNVGPLARRFQVIVPDMPGYGASAMPPLPYTPESLAQIIVRGLDEIVAPPAPLAMAGFSFGGIIAGHVAARLGRRLDDLILIGPNGMALPIPEITGVRGIDTSMSAAEVAAVHRHNLGRLMIADPGKVDDLAVHLQIENARRVRLKSGGIPASDSLLKALPEIAARIGAIWGGADAMTGPYLESREATLRRFQPDLDFRVVPGAGHWVPFEAADDVNDAIAGMLRQELPL